MGAPLTGEAVLSVEQELRYRLPGADVDLLRHQGGGMPRNGAHRTRESTSRAEDHVAIAGIFGVDRNRTYSLCEDLGGRFKQREWGYPPVGACFADCTFAGHDILCLDYRECGPVGESQVVHVALEHENRITVVARTFEAFIRGLEEESLEPDWAIQARAL